MDSAGLLPWEQLVHYCHYLSSRRLSSATSGNMSCRHGNRVYVTPSGSAFYDVAPEDILEMTLSGTVCSPQGRPSSEWPIHQALYQAREDIGAVVHAHPVKATALAAMHQSIDSSLVAESTYYLGEVPLIPYKLPGSEDLAEAVVSVGGRATAMLLANHGAITVGATLRDACMALELLEGMAEITLLAQEKGAPLSAEDMQGLVALKALKAQETMSV